MAQDRSRIEKLVDQFDPLVRDAFLAAVDEIHGRADLPRMVAALERGDVTDALAALHLEPEAFSALQDRIAEAFRTGGTDLIDTLPRHQTPAGLFVVRFNARNLRAEQWLRDYSSTLVKEIIDDQREAIRTALDAGMQRGVNPRQVALDIVGRFNQQTGKREGGVIGLTSHFESYAQTALIELKSGDPKLLRNYLTRARRDKRFDAWVEKAIEAQRPLTDADAARLVQRYRDRLLALRGETIGRTEAQTSLHAGQDEGLRQVIDTGAAEASSVGGIWRDSRDQRVRHTHREMNGQFQPVGQAFVSPSGARLMYPGDPRAPAAERIQCRCWREPKIDFLKGLR